MGLPHPDYLPDEITYQQLLDRKEYERTAWRREDYYWSMLLALVYNATRNEGQPAKSPEEFRYGYEPPDETDEIESGAKLRSILGAQ